MSEKRPGPGEEIKRCEIGSGRVLNGHLFCRRKFRLELVANRASNLGLDGEHVGEIAVVILRPKMDIRSSVDQLRADPDTVTGALHAAFQDVSDAELLPNFP